ncbi:hypothetical protein Ddye_015763 [Dipteronia dyeriana]|uniref:RNase H type-1 domain-containing protein n=1 Tax=Dipteronia dyeriana TaxID=168575 RepID=A0AAD9U6H3_9ROSI|nr:hypothetical protein Ddye_015763 [Dipteronia dyeriana]
MDEEVIKWAITSLDDFQYASEQFGGCVGGTQKSNLKWEPSDKNHYKLNADVAVDNINGRVGLGIVIHDSAGHFDPQMAEALSLWGGLVLTREVGLWPCHVETDAKVVVDLTYKTKIPRSEIGLVIQDIIQLLANVANYSLRFNPRTTNLVAHCLAKYGLNVEGDIVWLEECPPCVSQAVMGDCP